MSEFHQEIEELTPELINGIDEEERQMQFQFILDQLTIELNKQKNIISNLEFRIKNEGKKKGPDLEKM